MSVVLTRTFKDLSNLLKESLFSEETSSRKGLLQLLNAKTKIITLSSFIFVSVILHNLYLLILLGSISILLGLLSKIDIRDLIIGTTFFIPIYAGIIMTPILFFQHGENLLSLELLGRTLTITKEGLEAFSTFTLRVWVCVSYSFLLFHTTRFHEIAKALRKLGLPPLISTSLSMAFTYTFFFIDMIWRMLTARESRLTGKESFLKTIKNTSSIVGALLVRAYEKSERINYAMISRGYRGEIITLNHSALRKRDYVFMALSFSLLALVLFTELTGGST